MSKIDGYNKFRSYPLLDYLTLSIFEQFAKDNYNLTIDELLITGWYIKND